MFGGERGERGEMTFPEESCERWIFEYLAWLRLPHVTSEDQTVDWQQQSSDQSHLPLVLTVRQFAKLSNSMERSFVKFPIENEKMRKWDLIFYFCTAGDCCDCCLILLRLLEAGVESVRPIFQIILKILSKEDCGRARLQEISGLQQFWCLDKDQTSGLCRSSIFPPSSWAEWHCCTILLLSVKVCIYQLHIVYW